MDVDGYIADIEARMQAVGTWRPEFAPVVERLAVLYAERDHIEQLYAEDGSEPVVTHINKAGAANRVKNPFLAARDEVYSQLLAHERELGLTPAALKKLNEAKMKAQEPTGFAAILASLDGAAG